MFFFKRLEKEESKKANKNGLTEAPAKTLMSIASIFQPKKEAIDHLKTEVVEKKIVDDDEDDDDDDDDDVVDDLEKTEEKSEVKGLKTLMGEQLAKVLLKPQKEEIKKHDNSIIKKDEDSEEDESESLDDQTDLKASATMRSEKLESDLVLKTYENQLLNSTEEGTQILDPKVLSKKSKSSSKLPPLKSGAKVSQVSDKNLDSEGEDTDEDADESEEELPLKNEKFKQKANLDNDYEDDEDDDDVKNYDVCFFSIFEAYTFKTALQYKMYYAEIIRICKIECFC
jgi:hypothetical protein